MSNFKFIVIAMFFIVMASGCQTIDRQSSDNVSGSFVQDNELKNPTLSTPDATTSINTAQPTSVNELSPTAQPTPVELAPTVQPTQLAQPTASELLDKSDFATKDIKDTASVSNSTNITSDKPVDVTPKVTTLIEPQKTNIETQPTSTVKIETNTPIPTETPEGLNTPIVTCEGDVCRIIIN